jgi:Cu+-exporting ATPase
MHREISHTDEAFHPPSQLSLYLLTGLLALLMGLDLWPQLVRWLGVDWLPVWPNTLFGQRFALLAAILGGARILYTTIEGLLQGRVGADLALAIASVAALLLREYLVAAEIIFIGLVGECLESFTFARTCRAVRRLVEVAPRRCWLWRDGQEVRVRTTEVQPGDVVLVKPGARVPVDGVVLEGQSTLDVSALTGEPLPRDCGPGDRVLAGMLNQLGALKVRAERVAEQTTLGRVIELTARALKEKTTLERTADRLARWFLPVVLGLAALTFLGGLIYYGTSLFAPRRELAQAAWLSIFPALAVLVVACPCALILATPAAVIAALGRLAGTGVLLKGGAALERLAQVQAFAFDKTGTLTEGKLELGDIFPLENIPVEEVLRLAAAAEQASEHPLARVVVEEARRRGLSWEPVQDCQVHPGGGVVARSAQGTILVGNRRWLNSQGVSLSPQVEKYLQDLDAAGQTALLVAREGQLLGVLGARDRLRPEAADVLAQLRALGIRHLALLTGDRLAVARRVASQLGISLVQAELLPEQKADWLRTGHWPTAAEGGAAEAALPTAFVGDGINDAPALACATVGLAVGSGTDVAAEAGDIVLLGPPLTPLPLLVRLARATVRVIRQNILVFAFGVNLVGILLTAWLWPLLVPAPWYEQAPVAAVLYHQFGSLAVLLNSLRLLWLERPASPRLTRLRRAALAVDHWMQHYLNLDEALHWLSHHLRPVAGALGLLGLAAYALSGLTLIRPEEVAVVLRLGRPVAELGPGTYWRWPWPVETLRRVQPDRLRLVEVGFRTLGGDPPIAPGYSWASLHQGDGIVRIPDEALMITGDGNLVEVQATVRYRLQPGQIQTYLFEVRNPEEMIRAAAEAVLRQLFAARTFSEVLTVERGAFQEEALRALAQRCQRYGPHGLGIRLEGLVLHDLHPPAEVVPAYYEVTRAMEDHDRLINEAEAEATRKIQEAEAKSKEIVYSARAARTEKILQAEGYRDAFLARSAARHTLDLEQEWRLFCAALAETLAGLPSAQVEENSQRRRRAALALNATLTDFRLFWDTLGQALQGRQLVLIDAERVPGRRHLLLLDPELLRPPAPILLPPRGLPERRPLAEEPETGPAPPRP